MQLSHAHHKISVRFNDPNLVSCAGLVAVAALAERAGMPRLLERLTVPAANAGTKLLAVVLGMVATWICCATGRCADCSPASAPRRRWGSSCAASASVTSASSTPSAPGCWSGWWPAPRCCPAGRRSPTSTSMTPCARPTATPRRAPGAATPGSRGLNVLLATLSTPGRSAGSVPVIAAARLREGAAASVRGAWKLVADALATARRAGAGGLVIVRADSAYYAAAIVATARRAGARPEDAQQCRSVVTQEVRRGACDLRGELLTLLEHRLGKHQHCPSLRG